jgi:hypothetical protein
MAETKKAKKAKPRKSSASSKSKASSSKASSRSNGASTKSRKAASSASSSNGHGVAESVKETVVSGAHDAANGIAPVAQKAKLPLVATGAALVGAAAVIASKNGHKHKVLGVSMPRRSKVHLPSVHVPKIGMPKGKGVKADVRKAAGAVTGAAKQADELGRRISRVANSVQTVSETANDAAKKS